MSIDYNERQAYLRGYSQGYRDGHSHGIRNESRRRDFCKMCGIDLEHAMAIDYRCKSAICQYPHLKEEKQS